MSGLRVTYAGADGRAVEAVRGVSFTLARGEVLALVGESGSGKTATALALGGLLPPPPHCRVAGQVIFGGEELTCLPRRRLRALRGRRLAYVFQEPGASLNPVFTVGAQVMEVVRRHRPGLRSSEVRARAVELLERVGLAGAAARLGDYPHRFSGGMLQRVMLALALAGEPALLVADEPTTALDATIQRQILDLLADIRAADGLSILLITHNFGVVKALADRVAVMAGGEVVESGPVEQVLSTPAHPYPRGLLAAIPRPSTRRQRLRPGAVRPADANLSPARG